MSGVSAAPSNPRECGTCKACCTAEGVHELYKRPGEPCQFLCASGCGNYEKRPPSCQQFDCLWLQGVFEEDARPDVREVVFSMTPAPLRYHPWGRFVRAMELVLGAASRPECLEQIRWLTDKGEIVWVYAADCARIGSKVRIHYPDGVAIEIDPGDTFEQEVARIEAMAKGATARQASEQFPSKPNPPPRLAQDWLRDRNARRVIERGKPIPAVQRVYERVRGTKGLPKA